MIVKSYEILNRKKDLNKNEFFLIYGQNYGLKIDIKNYILYEFKKKYLDLEIISLEEDEVLKSEEYFYNLVYSKSLFQEKRMIIINRVTDKFIKYVEAIKDKNNNNVIFLMNSEILEKKSKLRNLAEKNEKIFCVACYEDTKRDLEMIVQKILLKNKLNLSNQTISFIIDKADGDRNNLKKELNKIALYINIDKKKDISFEDVKKLVSSTESLKTEQLINSCMSGDNFDFKKTLSELYVENINYILILKILSRKLERLIKIKKQINKFNNIDLLINQAKPPIFWKDKINVKKHLELWKLKDLNNLIVKLNKVELQCKIYSNLSSFIFFKFIIDAFDKAKSYS